MEARGRISDPVHGLAGIAKTHPQILDNLTSEHAFVNQFHHRRSVVPQQERRQSQSNEAKGASSSVPGAVPSPPLQEIGSGLA
ncbi:hypothetical protein MKW92_053501, partial [Papaver armeniacum]